MLKKIINKVIIGSCVGLTIGVIISIVFNLLNNSNVYYATSQSFYKTYNNHITPTIISFICFAIIGLISYLVSEIYDVKKINLFFKSIIHMLVIYFIVLLVGKYLQWFANISEIMTMSIIFLIIYFIIWGIMFFVEKNKIDEINKKLKER